MSSIGKGRVVLLILSVFLFLLAAGLASFLIFYKIPQKDSLNFYFSEFNRAMEKNNYRLAETHLNKASSFAGNSSDWKRVIKRSHRLSSALDDWDSFRFFSKRAVKLYGGNEEFWAYYLCSLLWTGRFEEAEKYSNRISREKFPTLVAELRLTRESLLIDDSLPPYNGVMERLEDGRDAEFYTLIGTITGFDDIRNNALLLWMGLEDKEKAQEIIESMTHPEEYAQVVGLAYWDMGLTKDSLHYLEIQNNRDVKTHNERWTLNNMLGDAFFLTNEWEKAEYHYLKSLEINDNDNWRPYVNRAIIYESIGIYKTASDIIFEGLSRYGDRREVVLYFMDNWLDTYPVRAERVVSRYLMNHPDDVDVLLEKFISFPEEMTPEKYHAFLWNLFNENCSSESVTRYLLWYMIGLGDYDSARIIMSRHAIETGYEPEWFSLYRGIIYALKSPGHLDAAAAEFQKYTTNYDDSYGEYNLNIILEKKN